VNDPLRPGDVPVMFGVFVGFIVYAVLKIKLLRRNGW
jgi:hypothetical protein